MPRTVLLLLLLLLTAPAVADSPRDLLLAARNGDLAEVYLENRETLNLTLDDSQLEKATQGNDIGAGVRVFFQKRYWHWQRDAAPAPGT